MKSKLNKNYRLLSLASMVSGINHLNIFIKRIKSRYERKRNTSRRTGEKYDKSEVSFV